MLASSHWSGKLGEAQCLPAGSMTRRNDQKCSPGEPWKGPGKVLVYVLGCCLTDALHSACPPVFSLGVPKGYLTVNVYPAVRALEDRAPLTFASIEGYSLTYLSPIPLRCNTDSQRSVRMFAETRWNTCLPTCRSIVLISEASSFRLKVFEDLEQQRRRIHDALLQIKLRTQGQQNNRGPTSARLPLCGNWATHCCPDSSCIDGKLSAVD